MAANVLNSPVAVRANIVVVRKLDALEKKLEKHDAQFRVVFDAIRQLMEPPPAKRRSIGFHAGTKKEP